MGVPVVEAVDDGVTLGEGVPVELGDGVVVGVVVIAAVRLAVALIVGVVLAVGSEVPVVLGVLVPVAVAEGVPVPEDVLEAVCELEAVPVWLDEPVLVEVAVEAAVDEVVTADEGVLLGVLGTMPTAMLSSSTTEDADTSASPTFQMRNCNV